MVTAIALSSIMPLGCGNSSSSASNPDARRAAIADASSDDEVLKPKNFQVERFRRTIESAKLTNVEVEHVIEMGNRATPAQLSFMFDFSRLMGNLGMSGDDIHGALVQIEDPFPEKGFPVKRGPRGFENMGLSALLNRAEKAFHAEDDSNLNLGSRYDESSKTLFITMTQDGQDQ